MKTKFKISKIRIGKTEFTKFDSYQRAAARLAAEFRRRGFETFWVGGAVRDLLLNRKNFDIDLATQAAPEQIKRILKILRLRFFALGEKFGTIAALIPGRKGDRQNSRQIEITSFRSERGYGDFRHPSKVRFGVAAEKDLQRRDFTVNGLLLDPAGREVFDYVGGLKDLRAKQLRFIGSAAARIKADPLRSLRAVRFAAELGFKIVPKDFAAIKKSARLIEKISGERIKRELDRLLAGGNFIAGLELLESSGLLQQILPEVARLKAVKQSKNFHAEGNVWKHTLLVLDNLRGGDLVIRWAGLLHDIGKYNTGRPTVKENRRHISFHGHARQSAALFKSIARRLHFSRADADKILYLLLHHMDLRPIETISEHTLIRWSKNPNFADLVKLRVADSLGAIQTDLAGRMVRKEIQDWLELLPKIRRWQKPAPKKIIDGRDVMRTLGLKPGEKIGEILERVEILRRQGKIKTRQQGITFLKTLDND